MVSFAHYVANDGMQTVSCCQLKATCCTHVKHPVVIVNVPLLAKLPKAQQPELIFLTAGWCSWVASGKHDFQPFDECYVYFTLLQ